MGILFGRFCLPSRAEESKPCRADPMMKKTAPKSKADWWKAHYTAYGLIYQILFWV
jgi:hypothetical protein